jgi:hypothetical protein
MMPQYTYTATSVITIGRLVSGLTLDTAHGDYASTSCTSASSASRTCNQVGNTCGPDDGDSSDLFADGTATISSVLPKPIPSLPLELPLVVWD